MDIQPIFVVAVGRSGTTLLMRLLSEHPEIVAERAYPLEFRAFFAAALSNTDRDFESAHNRDAIIKAVHDYPLSGDKADILHQAREEGMSPEVARDIYRKIAASQGKMTRYAAEKFVVRMLPAAMEATRKVYPQAKYVILLRDPRDVILSARAFDAKRGWRGFLEKDGDSDEDVVLKYKSVFGNILNIEESHHQVRILYEDLIYSRRRTMSKLFSFLGIDPYENADSPVLDHHRTAISESASVRRWPNEMAERTQQLCIRHMGDTIAALGFDIRKK